MAIIYVPSISPFSVKGALQEAGDSHIQSHHLAYEIANHSRKLDQLICEYEAQVALVTALQDKVSSLKARKNKELDLSLKVAEKELLASRLPHEIKTLQMRVKDLKADLMALTTAD